jgi:hypothetical protein
VPLWQRQKIQTLLRPNRLSLERPRGTFVVPIVVLPPAIGYRLLAMRIAGKGSTILASKFQIQDSALSDCNVDRGVLRESESVCSAE